MVTNEPLVTREASVKNQGPTQERMLKDRLRSSMWVNLLFQPLIMVLSVIGSVVVARSLGPALMAVLAAVSATSATVTSFLDFGITRSLPKIMPDVSVRFGRRAAVQVQRRLTLAKLILVCVGLLVVLLLDL